LTDTAGVWTVGGTTVDVGPDSWLASTALSDFDGDGSVESNLDELTGLTGSTVDVQVQPSAGGAAPVLIEVNGAAYRDTTP
jgi:hypothetical protein